MLEDTELKEEEEEKEERELKELLNDDEDREERDEEDREEERDERLLFENDDLDPPVGSPTACRTQRRSCWIFVRERREICCFRKSRKQRSILCCSAGVEVEFPAAGDVLISMVEKTGRRGDCICWK